MYDSCLSNNFAWKGFLPYFPPIWCIFAAPTWRQNSINRRRQISTACIDEYICTISLFNLNTSETCTQVSYNSYQNEEIWFGFLYYQLLVKRHFVNNCVSLLISEFVHAPSTPTTDMFLYRRKQNIEYCLVCFVLLFV